MGYCPNIKRQPRFLVAARETSCLCMSKTRRFRRREKAEFFIKTERTKARIRQRYCSLDVTYVLRSIGKIKHL